MDDAVETIAPEELITRAWCIEQLERECGVVSYLANFLVDQVDWHELRRLLRAGCPLDLALDILR